MTGSNLPNSGPESFNEGWKGDLYDLKGRTITGHATGATNGRLQDLMLTLDDGTWISFVVRGDLHGFIDVIPSVPASSTSRNQEADDGR